ncbi:hypothetical protein A3A75_04085 [Candidatus Woesebacteria bacterium RIFCSPLOWO2_01_FULL_39_10]|uniref:Uncharacterized protein n=1 Tax=Candidatus Woesebacteria bacterium RIFCSPLOWO2_01_FULL_39_10 TaxID=1802516 RepID=A0A1F8B8M8_9BACT|nr:MAG: hypothetical protein A3A75_04085 [Candidatus Woesebacteria bacterium RIFCSPLOWO2_01_FULL_39_10]
MDTVQDERTGYFWYLGFLNKFISTLIIALAFQSIFSVIQISNLFLTSFSIILSYLLSLIAERTAKYYYHPAFINKNKMNLADWIDIHIGHRKGTELVDENLFEARSKFEFDFLATAFSLGFALIMYVAVGIFDTYKNYPNEKLSPDHFINSIAIFIVYGVFLLFVYVGFEAKKHSKGVMPLGDKFAIIVSFVFLISIVIDSIFKLW